MRHLWDSNAVIKYALKSELKLEIEESVGTVGVGKQLVRDGEKRGHHSF